MQLTDKVALVTGGANRVGRATAVKLAEAGCHVAITYFTSKEAAAQTVELIGMNHRKAWAIPMDLNDPLAPSKLRKAVLEATGHLDVLVHNASVYRPTPWGSIQREAWHEHLRVNLTAPVMITQELAEALAAGEGGRVIHLLDVHAMGRPRKGYAAYTASKAALAGMTHALALELAPHVTVNAIAPGVVAWAPDMSQRQREAYLQRVPLGRAGTVEDAARAVVYLARDGDYLTGQTIRVDGGRWLG